MASDLGKVSVYTIPTGLPVGSVLYTGDVVIEATDDEHETICFLYNAKAGQWESLSSNAIVMDWSLTQDGKRLTMTINNYSLQSLSLSKVAYVRNPFAGAGSN